MFRWLFLDWEYIWLMIARGIDNGGPCIACGARVEDTRSRRTIHVVGCPYPVIDQGVRNLDDMNVVLP